jgi:hypothetical protein
MPSSMSAHVRVSLIGSRECGNPHPSSRSKAKQKSAFHRATSEKVQTSFFKEISDVHTVDVSNLHCRIMNCSIICMRSHRSKDKQTVESQETVPISAANLKRGELS